CADAFQYIWSKKLLACEMLRLIGKQGAAIIFHLHTQACEEDCIGMPLSTASYRGLFDGTPVRLYRESELFDRLIHGQPLDLSGDVPDEALENEPALLLLAAWRRDLFRVFRPMELQSSASARLSINPLYQSEDTGEITCLRLQFPSEEYAI